MTSQWQGRREGGGFFGMWLIRSVGLYGGRRVARIFLYPITLYFFFRRGSERRASYAYLERIHGRPATALEVMRHIHCFSSTILDRVFLLTERFRRFEINVVGLEVLKSQLQANRGVLLLGGHIGSFEVLRVLAGECPDVPVHPVLDTQQTPALTRVLHALNPQIAADVIDASRPATEIVLAIKEAIDAGGIVTLLADRARPHEATVSVDFMGSPAEFPIGPLLIGATLDAPIVLAFGIYRGGRRYDLCFEPFADHLSLPRGARQEALRTTVQRFATCLEAKVRDAPYNWFNLYDFWDAEDESADKAGTVESGVARAAVPRRAA